MMRYSLIPRSGTLITRSRSLPMIDSSAMMSAIFSRIDSRTFWRWRARSPAERSECSASERLYSRKMLSRAIFGSRGFLRATTCYASRALPWPQINHGAMRVRARPGPQPYKCSRGRRSPLILPEIVGGVLEHHVDARFAVAILQQVAHHRAVLLGLLLVAGAGLGDDPRDVAHRGPQLLFDRLFERLVAAVADFLAAPRGRPQVGDHFLAETVGGRADNRDLLLDRFQEALIRRQLFLGVAVT